MIHKMWGHCKAVNDGYYPAPFSGRDITEFGNKEKGDYGYGVETAEYIIIVFGGSNDLWDWISNIFKVGINGRGYHSGFYAGAESMKGQVFDFIKSAGNKPIYLGGVSRGGSVACIMADMVYQMLDSRPLHQEEIHTIHVYTFGAGKFCSAKAKFDELRWLGEIGHTLVINGIDVVPSLPFWGKYIRSATRVIRIGKRPTTMERARIWAYLFTGLWSKFAKKYGKAHRSKAHDEAMGNYYE